jgi:hypothetical protein
MADSDPLGPAIGAELLSELGFLHVPGPPLTASRAYLFVALRRRPTLRHFDPERVDYWVADEHVGTRATLELSTPRQRERDYEWGSIRIVDRLSVANEYVSFGGRLTVDRAEGVTVAVFSSDAPILARGGHSQGWDPLAEEAAAYAARLRAVIGRSRDLEHAIADASPIALYAAFVIAEQAREESAARIADLHPTSQALLRREARRLSTQLPLDWAAGQDLAARLAGHAAAPALVQAR